MNLLNLFSSWRAWKAPRCGVLLAGVGFLAGAAWLVSGADPLALSVKRAVRLSFQSNAGDSYQVYRSTDLMTWSKYGDLIVGTGNEVALTHITEGDRQSVFRAEKLLEAVNDLPDFKPYPNWKLVGKVFGPNPVLAGAHGEKSSFRFTYVYPADARLVNGRFPIGTMVVKELRKNNNGEPGDVAGALTIMVKRGGNFNPEGNGWEYFMTDTALSQTALRGGSETMCFLCHSIAKDADFVFNTNLVGP